MKPREWTETERRDVALALACILRDSLQNPRMSNQSDFERANCITQVLVQPASFLNDNLMNIERLLGGLPTGRLTESKPNLQNIPIKSELGKEIRKKFTGK